MTAQPHPGAWAAAIHSLHDEAAGLLVLDVVRRCDAPDLVLAAAAGDDYAARLLVAVNDALRNIEKAPTGAPMQCAACAAPLRLGRFALCIARPATADPMQGLGMAICHRCGTTRGGIHAAASASLRLIWPDARPITVTHPDGGRA